MKDLKFYMKDSLKNGYCLGAYNIVNMEVIKGVLDGCQKSQSPCFLAVSEGAIKYMNLEYLISMIEASRKVYKDVPIFLHLDHGKNFEICKLAIDAGFDSVMIDASSLPFEENIKATKEVVEYAHSKGVLVEAELGVLKGIEDDIQASESVFTDPDSAKEFVEKTGCDFLAVAVGTSHGAYKFNGESKIRTDILSKIEEKLPDYPLVLHGASSVPQKYIDEINAYDGQITGAKGVDEEILSEACVKHNVFKINTDTDIRLAYTASVRKYNKEHPENFDIRKINQAGQDEIANYIADKNINVFHNANRN